MAPVHPSAHARRTRSPALVRPRLSVVVNYRLWPNTARLVRQLRQSEAAKIGDAEIVVVDNGSLPHPAVKRLKRRRGVRLHLDRWNRGFAAGANAAARPARDDWLLLLSPDATVPPGFLDDAFDSAERHRREQPGVGVVGFRLRNPDGTDQGSCRVEQTFATTVLRLLRAGSKASSRHPGRTDTTGYPRTPEGEAAKAIFVARRADRSLPVRGYLRAALNVFRARGSPAAPPAPAESLFSSPGTDPSNTEEKE